jgi:ribosomal-protein-alanine N-acetyltransferase
VLNWTIRPAVPEDLEALTALEARFPSDRLRRESWRRFVGARSAEIWVADRAGSVAGDAVVLYRRNSRRARLYSLVVSDCCSGQGIGRALLSVCERAARRRGCRELVLEVRPDNAAALALYQTSDYRVIRRREEFYEDGSAALLLGKTLEAATLPSVHTGDLASSYA